ncbi:MAG TPA: Gfo/Idh/MocA family oxidoreductase, partial [Erysipelothrix sp.]|nr:Gfo/Idh/MocA family oxidoreductase [Erysipelothrix sp.]
QATLDGYKNYESYQSMLEDAALDVILIATPNEIHKDLSIEAMNHNKHVICEKPVTLTSKELQEIMDVAKKTGKTFMVHQNRRWDDDYLVAKNLYDNKQVGDLFHIESRVHGANGIPGDWRAMKKHGGGMLYDWGVHLLDQILQMVQSPLDSVENYLSFVLGHDADDGFTSLLKFKDGTTCLVEVSTTSFIQLPRWYVKGTEGTAIINDWNLNGKTVKYNVDAKHIAPTPIKAGAGLTKTMAPLNKGSIIEEDLPKPLEVKKSFYDNFYEVVNHNQNPLVKNEEVKEVMVLIEKMFEAHHTNSVVYMP